MKDGKTTIVGKSLLEIDKDRGFTIALAESGNGKLTK